MSELKITHYVVSGISVIKLEGKITTGEGAITLRETFRKYLNEGTKKIVIELGGVAYVDSSGIGEMVSTFTLAGRMGCTVAYADLSNHLRDFLTATKLLTVFDVYPTVKEAVQRLNNI